MSTPTAPLAATAPATIADAVLPRASGLAAGARALVLVVAGAALTALAAQVAFTMPWSPVPYTGQTAAVLLVGTALGWRLGAASMAVYVLAGVVGAPVFAGGAHGIGQLIGITGGYLAGFVLAAALVGRLAEANWDRSPLRAAGLMAAGNVAIYAVGVPVLALSAGLDPASAAWGGAAVFLPWDAAKVLLAAGLLPLAWLAIGGRR